MPVSADAQTSFLAYPSLESSITNKSAASRIGFKCSSSAST
jgi:hypothetical protein